MRAAFVFSVLALLSLSTQATPSAGIGLPSGTYNVSADLAPLVGGAGGGSGGNANNRSLNSDLYLDAELQWDATVGMYLAWDNTEDEAIAWVRITGGGGTYTAECFEYAPMEPMAIGGLVGSGTFTATP